MFRTHAQPGLTGFVWRALAAGLAATLLVAPVTPAQALATAPAPSLPPPTDSPGTQPTGTQQTDSSQTNAPQTGSNQTGTNQTGTTQTDSSQTNAPQTGSTQTGTNQTGSTQTGTNQTGTNQTGTGTRPAVPPPPAVFPPSLNEEAPDAGDANIPVEAPEPGQVDTNKPRAPSRSTANGGGLRIDRKGTVEVGYQLAAEGDAAFDAENYGEAARLYTKSLGMLPENETNHVIRSVVLANAVTAYQQVYTLTHELDHLRTAQRLLQEYLKACKTKHGNGCDRYSETQDARARLQIVMADIDTAAPKTQKIPPEIGATPGGKPFDNAVELPEAPVWIAPSIVGGLLVAGGGTALAFWAAQTDKYGPLYVPKDLEFRDTADTADTGSIDTEGSSADTESTVDTDGSTATTDLPSLTPQQKGKLLMGVGSFLAVAGVGFVVLGIIGLAKHRRINRERARNLAVSPTFGRGAAGLAISGRF